MNWKTLALAGTATFALMAGNAAFAQNEPAATAPAATDATAPSATDAPAADTAAAPAKKHHKHHKKAAASESSEEQTTAQLNQQQAQKPGSTPMGTSNGGAMGNDTAAPSPSMNNTAPGTPGTTDTSTKPMDNSNDAQKPLMGGQNGAMPAPADNGNTANPAAQSDKMGDGDMHMKADDMKNDTEKKAKDATTTPPTTSPTP